jgi:hypothetical protein
MNASPLAFAPVLVLTTERPTLKNACTPAQLGVVTLFDGGPRGMDNARLGLWGTGEPIRRRCRLTALVTSVLEQSVVTRVYRRLRAIA